MHRTLSTGPSTIAALMAASRPEPAPARDTTALPDLARPRGHARRPRDAARPAPAPAPRRP